MPDNTIPTYQKVRKAITYWLFLNGSDIWKITLEGLPKDVDFAIFVWMRNLSEEVEINITDII